MTDARDRPPLAARVSAGLALLGFVLVLVIVVRLLTGHGLYLLGTVACLGVGVGAAWAAATSDTWRRTLWAVAVVVLLGGLALLFIAGESVLWLLMVAVIHAVMVWAGGRA